MKPPPRDTELQNYVSIGHDQRDANVGWLLISAGGLLVLVVGTLLLMNAAFRYFTRVDQQTDPRPSPLAAARVQGTGPRLQADPYTDLKDYQAREREILQGYYRHYAGGKELDTVSIPIDRAMQLLVERGLPKTPASAPATRPAGTGEDTRGAGATGREG